MYRFLVEMLQPYSVVWMLLLISVLAAWKSPRLTRRRRILLSTSFLFLTLISTPALAYLILGSLEWHYPVATDRPADVQAIVVLAGGLRAPNATRTQAELGTDTIYRCVLGGQLYHAGAACPVIVTGGIVEPDTPGPPVAEVMRDFLIEMGVTETDVVVEHQSRTTYENAVNVAELLKQRGIRRVALVTDATHMLRSEWCFQKQGIEIVPRGSYFRATEFQWEFLDFWPSPHAIVEFHRVLHEWLGIVWYKLHGRI